MTKLIPLSQNGKYRGKYFAIIDDEDYERVITLTWRVMLNYGKRYYAASELKGKKLIYMHRLILQVPNGMMVDHIDGNGLNNTKSNLRIATPTQNLCNSFRSDHSAGYKGVSREDTKFVARIWYGCIRTRIGRFSTPEEAARAYDRKAIELHGEFARTNFPRSDYEVNER